MSKKFVELGTLGILTFDDVQINAAQLTPNGPAFYQEKKLYKDRTIASKYRLFVEKSTKWGNWKFVIKIKITNI